MKNAIIVADDSKIIHNIIERSIDKELTILRAYNGMEVIQHILDNKEYDIKGILLDLNMPNYDGFVVLNYFKTNGLFDKIPVFIISGDDSKETIDKAFTYNIVDLLNKPFTKEKIAQIIDRMIV